MTEPTSALRAMIRMQEIVERIHVGRSTIYRWMERDQFPRPINLGDGVIAFYEDEVVEWQKNREAQSVAPPRPILQPIRPRLGRRHPRRRSAPG